MKVKAWVMWNIVIPATLGTFVLGGMVLLPEGLGLGQFWITVGGVLGIFGWVAVMVLWWRYMRLRW